MTELERFAAADRVLVVAPHPDDESIATGGVLQAAGAAGAARRVLLVTDGDNNPWPQRWAEKRWTIGAAERARWGARRRAEALAALAVLGVERTNVHCLGLPDLGLTPLLMDPASDCVERLRGELQDFRPTHVFLPDAGDRHPDHNALHVLLRLALSRCADVAPRLYTFGVHGAAAEADARVALTLTPAQRETKRRAIEQHATQMLLSRRRFVGYAREHEPFRCAAATPAPDPQNPLRAAFDDAGDLLVQVDETRWRGTQRGRTLFIVLDAAGHAVRASVPFFESPVRLASASVTDALTFVLERPAPHVVLRAKTGLRFTSGWVKLGSAAPGLFVLDRHGWQAVGAAGA